MHLPWCRVCECTAWVLASLAKCGTESWSHTSLPLLRCPTLLFKSCPCNECGWIDRAHSRLCMPSCACRSAHPVGGVHAGCALQTGCSDFEQSQSLMHVPHAYVEVFRRRWLYTNMSSGCWRAAGVCVRVFGRKLPHAISPVCACRWMTAPWMKIIPMIWSQSRCQM
jgi:hypothetical protein